MRASSRGLGELIHAALDDRPTSPAVPRRHGHGRRRRRSAGGVRRLPCPCPRCVRRAEPLLGPRGAAYAFGPKGASRHRWRSWRRGCPRGRASAGRRPAGCRSCWGHWRGPRRPRRRARVRSRARFRARWIPRARPLRRARRHRRGHRRPRDARGRRRESRSGLRRGRSPLRCFRRTDQRAAIWCRAARAERRPGPGARISSLSESCSESRSRTGRASRSCFASACRSFHAICELPSTSGRNSQAGGEPVAPELGVGRDRRPGALVDQRQLSEVLSGAELRQLVAACWSRWRLPRR